FRSPPSSWSCTESTGPASRASPKCGRCSTLAWGRRYGRPFVENPLQRRARVTELTGSGEARSGRSARNRTSDALGTAPILVAPVQRETEETRGHSHLGTRAGTDPRPVAPGRSGNDRRCIIDDQHSAFARRPDEGTIQAVAGRFAAVHPYRSACADAHVRATDNQRHPGRR